MRRSLLLPSVGGGATSVAGLLVLLAPTPAAAWRTLGERVGDPVAAPGAVNELATAVTSLGAWLVIGWLVLAASLIGVSAIPGRSGLRARWLSELLIPRLIRNVLAATLGVSLITGVAAAPAYATSPGPDPLPSVSATTNSLDLNWPLTDQSPQPTHSRPHSHGPSTPPTPAPSAHALDQPHKTEPAPHPPTSAAPSTPKHSAASQHQQQDQSKPPPPHVPQGAAHRDSAPPITEVVVLPGDALWAIAARQLGPTATDQQIAQEWPRWWSANRAVIGDNPAIIRAGQRLIPPA